jgi:translation elongation factor EF-4
VLVRVFDGTLKAGMRVKMMQNGSTHLIDRVGVFLPKNTPVESLGPGEVGFITAQIKEVADAAVGDTITDEKKPTAEPCKGFKDVQPVVFCGLFPVDAADFEDLRAAIGRLRLNDASFTYRDGIQRRARLRLPLRLPRPAASGDHPGAPQPRVQPRPDRDRPVGGLQDRPARRAR